MNSKQSPSLYVWNLVRNGKRNCFIIHVYNRKHSQCFMAFFWSTVSIKESDGSKLLMAINANYGLFSWTTSTSLSLIWWPRTLWSLERPFVDCLCFVFGGQTMNDLCVSSTTPNIQFAVISAPSRDHCKGHSIGSLTKWIHSHFHQKRVLSLFDIAAVWHYGHSSVLLLSCIKPGFKSEPGPHSVCSALSVST